MNVSTKPIWSGLGQFPLFFNPFILAFYCCTGFAAAQSPPPISYLTAKDSLFLTVVKQEKVVKHLVKPKQTLFSLTKFYGLSLEELYNYNPEFVDNPVLKAGSRVIIPVPNRAIKRYKREGFIASKHTPIYYVVQPGDNLFHICKRYFEMPVDSIAKRNKLSSNAVKPGQLLLVGWMSTNGIPADIRPVRKVTPFDALHERYEGYKATRRQHIGQGMCFWQKDSRESSDMYALHREAAIGTVIGITNPKTGRVAYAKVIGRVPANYQHSIEVIIAPAAARYLGATRQEFFVKVKFFR
jgi:LysM repeat protein